MMMVRVMMVIDDGDGGDGGGGDTGDGDDYGVVDDDGGDIYDGDSCDCKQEKGNNKHLLDIPAPQCTNTLPPPSIACEMNSIHDSKSL